MSFKLNIKIISAVLLLALSAPAYSQTLKINLRLNTKEADSKNFLAWTYRGSKTQDSVDSFTSASKKHSTMRLREVLFSKDKKTKLAPKGFYSLMLFAVSDFNTMRTDSLAVESSSSKKISITFIHRGYAYRIESDENGKIELASSFLISGKIAENQKGKFVFLSKYTSEENPDTIDFSKVAFEPDTADLEQSDAPTEGSEQQKIYSGALQARYDGKILRIKGNLKLKPQIIKKDKTETPPAQENTEENALPQSPEDIMQQENDEAATP